MKEPIHTTNCMSVKISVIIPSYKPKDYIDSCLESLAMQTLDKKSYQVILILNGSGEPWVSALKSKTDALSLKYSLDISLIVTERGNVSNARNIGLDMANGEYICFIDDDDYVSPCYLEKLLEKSGKDTVSLCYPLSFIEGRDDFEPSYCMTQEYQRCFKRGIQPFYRAKKFFQGPCMKLIHRDIIGDRRFDIRLQNGEDTVFMFLISDRIKYVDFTGTDAVYYRRIRPFSAQSTLQDKRKRVSIAWNKMRMCVSYYMRSPFKYNFYFFVTRILASGKTLIKG